MRHMRGFTLIEMLVVIAIITLLISIASPSLRASKEAGRSAKCLSQMRQLGVATDNFTIDHKDRLPGITGAVWVNPSVPGGGCWLSNPISPQTPYEAAPDTGEIWTYAGRDAAIYRCPSLHNGVVGSGVGSNGKFDYSAFHAFAGTRIYNVPKSAVIKAPNYNDEQVRTPWIIEESPDQHLNRTNVEGGFGGTDLIGNWHNGGCNLITFDGSGVSLRNTKDLSSMHFFATTPSGVYTPLSSHSSGWGGWEQR